MIRTGLQFSGGDRFHQAAKSRRKELRRAKSDISPAILNDKVGKSINSEPENRSDFVDYPKPETFEPVVSHLSNLERFLESVTPFVPPQHLSKTTMRGWRICDVEFRPYFVLGDLWESFREWSAYGAGVPVILNNTDSVVQYYVPYLSAIQIYEDSVKSCIKSSRGPGIDSDSDFRDSSSDGSSDCEPDGGPNSLINKGGPNRLSVRDRQNHTLQDDFSSDEGESCNSQGRLLFEYLERDPPYGREPLADKISDLALGFPGLKTLRSCDLLSSSWLSVAWYPIYRIPTGPTLRDLDACFLTYHSLHTPLGGNAHAPVVTYPTEMDGVPRMSLPIFGLASYKFKGPLWTSSGGCEYELANCLLQAADNWLRLVQVNHPDFMFFYRR